MSNRILRLDCRSHSTIPAEAEVRITVVPQRLTPTTELRGRLMGPRCLFANTIEVAYHLRPLPPGSPVPPEALTARAIIPEASLWEPECPFLYEGPVELWQDGQRCDGVTVRHGLRTVALSPRGLRVNGRALVLRGQSLPSCSEAEALELRRTGHNLLVVPVSAAGAWEVADRVGLFVLGRLRGEESERAQAAALASHPSSLGWLVEAGAALPEGLPGLVGALGAAVEGAAFVAGPPEALSGVTLPALVLGEVPAEATNGALLGGLRGPFG